MVGAKGAGLFLELGAIHRSNFCSAQKYLIDVSERLFFLLGKCSPFWAKTPLVVDQYCACGPCLEFFCAQTVAPAADLTYVFHTGPSPLRHSGTKPELARSLDLLRIFQNGVSEQSKIDHLQIQF